MTEAQGRRRPKKLSAETKWEIFLQVTTGENTQADAVRKWQVDVSTNTRWRVGLAPQHLHACVTPAPRPQKLR
jgi:transposase-like protein